MRRFRPSRFQIAHATTIALGLVTGGLSAWAGCTLGGRAAWAIGFVAVSTAIVAYGLAGLWMAPFIGDRPLTWLSDLRLAPKRVRRMEAVLEFLPERPGPGWGPLYNPQGTSGWFAFSDDVLIATWLAPYENGHELQVALGRKGGGSVSDERAGEILAQFRGVGPFWEATEPPDLIRDRFPPNARMWVAVPYEAIEKTPVRVRPRPTILDKPLNEHLRAVRTHLPSRLPESWSVPLAVTERLGNYDGGAWFVEEDDAAFTVCLVGSLGRAKLCVIIWLRAARPVSVHFFPVPDVAVSDFDQETDSAPQYAATKMKRPGARAQLPRATHPRLGDARLGDARRGHARQISLHEATERPIKVGDNGFIPK